MRLEGGGGGLWPLPQMLNLPILNLEKITPMGGPFPFFFLHGNGIVNPFSPSQFISMSILLTLSTQNKLFGNDNKVNNHTQQFILEEKQNSPNLFTRKL